MPISQEGHNWTEWAKLLRIRLLPPNQANLTQTCPSSAYLSITPGWTPLAPLDTFGGSGGALGGQAPTAIPIRSGGGYKLVHPEWLDKFDAVGQVWTTDLTTDDSCVLWLPSL
jgi:hypothetical protein